MIVTTSLYRILALIGSPLAIRLKISPEKALGATSEQVLRSLPARFALLCYRQILHTCQTRIHGKHYPFPGELRLYQRRPIFHCIPNRTRTKLFQVSDQAEKARLYTPPMDLKLLSPTLPYSSIS